MYVIYGTYKKRYLKIIRKSALWIRVYLHLKCVATSVARKKGNGTRCSHDATSFILNNILTSVRTVNTQLEIQCF